MSIPRPQQPRCCVICGSTEKVEANHAGGRNHVAWFTSPLCGKHHDEFHFRLRLGEIDLRYTPDEEERLSRARQALLILLFMLEERLKQSMLEKRSKK